MKKDKNITRDKEISKDWNMANKCTVTNCTSGYTKDLKSLLFHFPEDVELKKKWIYFVNWKGWTPNLNSVICAERIYVQMYIYIYIYIDIYIYI